MLSVKVCAARANGSSTERGFSNPREFADKNVRAPLDSELRVLRGEQFLSSLVAAVRQQANLFFPAQSGEKRVLLSMIISVACANVLGAEDPLDSDRPRAKHVPSINSGL